MEGWFPKTSCRRQAPVAQAQRRRAARPPGGKRAPMVEGCHQGWRRRQVSESLESGVPQNQLSGRAVGWEAKQAEGHSNAPKSLSDNSNKASAVRGWCGVGYFF